MRWAAAGVLLGSLVAGLVFAPASWLASALSGASGQRLLLADARGTVWQGSAVMVLTGGEGSHDASALPGRLHWTVGLEGMGLALRARHACCINGELRCAWCPAWPACAWTCPLCKAPSGNGQRPGWWAWAHPGTRCSLRVRLNNLLNIIGRRQGRCPSFRSDENDRPAKHAPC
jgi:general secretion pathway protein N